MNKITLAILLTACSLLTVNLTAQNNNHNLFGTSNQVTICTEYTGAGELPTGAYMGGITSSATNNFSIIGNAFGVAGTKLLLGYCSGTNWLSGLELANTSSGYGNLALMKSGGNVGIGTATPDAALRIWRKYGDGDAKIGITAHAYTLVLSEGEKENIAKVLYDGNDLRLGTNNIDVLNIKGILVGIGTVSPTTKLDVYQGAILSHGTGAGISLSNDTDSTLLINPVGSGQIRFKTDVTGRWMSFADGAGTADTLVVRNSSVCVGTTTPQSGYKFTVSSGNSYVGGDGYFTGIVTTGSSRTLKKGIQDLTEEEALTTLKELKPVKFQYKADKSETQRLGFIAEDVPALVAEKDRKSLSDMNFTTLAITVIQKQQKQIEDLEKKLEIVSQLEKKLALLTQKVEKE